MSWKETQPEPGPSYESSRPPLCAGGSTATIAIALLAVRLTDLLSEGIAMFERSSQVPCKIGHMTIILVRRALASAYNLLRFKVHTKPALPANYEVREFYYEGFVEDLGSLLTRFKHRLFKAETITTLIIILILVHDPWLLWWSRQNLMADRIHEPSENQSLCNIIITWHVIVYAW